MMPPQQQQEKHSSNFSKLFDKKSKKVSDICNKQRSEAQSERYKLLGLNKNTTPRGFVDYGFGYRDCVPEGHLNLENYESDDGKEESTGQLLPLKSELAYKKRRGLSNTPLPVQDRIRVTLKNGMVKLLKRKQRDHKATDTNVDRYGHATQISLISGQNLKKRKQSHKNKIQNGMYFAMGSKQKQASI